MLSRFVVSQVKHNSYFIVGVVLGLWITLAVVPLEDEASIVACPVPSEANADEFEPHREERPLGPAGPAAGRSVQRPRYYTTELGIRGSLMSGVLSSEEALKSRTAALNQTAARLQPLRVFVSAAAGSMPPRPNVVGFTDSREMLKPFNTLKYLADNYLEEYDFFFLVSDTSFVNARRLQELVSKLSVSQDVYMGTIAEDDSHYCTLEGGILLSNSVLRAVHPELDWCVRNSYSAHHHENLGRCVLHAAHCRCRDTLMGEQYTSVVVAQGEAPSPTLAAAVTAHPVTEPAVFYALHAYVSRVFLERDAAEAGRLRAQLARGLARHPDHHRNTSWPAGLRADPGLRPPPPPTRFDYLRWTWFNTTHVLMPDDHRAVAALRGVYADAAQLVLKSVKAWGSARWGRGPGPGAEPSLVEGAWRWEPPHALRYRLVVRAGGLLRTVEAARALGAARVAAAPYVTEGARLTLLLPLPPPLEPRRLHAAAERVRRLLPLLRRDRNCALLLVLFRDARTNETAVEELRQVVRSADFVELVEVEEEEGQAEGAAVEEEEGGACPLRRALEAARPHVAPHALLLLLPDGADCSQDLLNRARMNSIPGVQWFWAAGFERYAQYAHPRQPAGRPPPAGHFRLHRDRAAALAFYRADYDAAAGSWRGPRGAGVERVLHSSGLRCLRAPEPALVLEPPAAPCAHQPAGGPPQCVRAAATLPLGDRHTLARLLLEHQADADADGGTDTDAGADTGADTGA